MRTNYIKFIARLSKKYSKEFGSVWWYSLLHEKNSAGKSRTYHNIIKGLRPSPFSVYRAFTLALRKYIGFVIRHFIFADTGFKMYVGYDTFYMTYNDNFMSPLSEGQPKIYLPQKHNYKEFKNKWVIDHFVGKWDLVKLPFKYFSCLWNTLYLIPILKKEFTHLIFIYHYFKEEVWRSFAGDVLVEGLFYEIAFANMAKQFKNLKRVVYPYEGQAWEKALCKGFNQIDNRPEIVAVLCACPPLNMLNYWYDKEEVDIMPTPDRIGVLGQTTYNLFKEMYGGKTFVIGPMRFRNIEKLLNKEVVGNRVTVILPGVKEYADELLNFVECVDTGGLQMTVKPHPDYRLIRTKGSDNKFSIYFGKDLEYLLLNTKVLISTDSSISFMAAALGIPVIIPDLETIAIMNPLMIGEDFKRLYYIVKTPLEASNRIELLKGIDDRLLPLYLQEGEKVVRSYFDFTKNEREEILK